jgi:hypothetical protein
MPRPKKIMPAQLISGLSARIGDDFANSHEPSVILAEQHAVGEGEADIDLVAFAEHM